MADDEASQQQLVAATQVITIDDTPPASQTQAQQQQEQQQQPVQQSIQESDEAMLTSGDEDASSPGAMLGSEQSLEEPWQPDWNDDQPPPPSQEAPVATPPVPVSLTLAEVLDELDSDSSSLQAQHRVEAAPARERIRPSKVGR